MFHRKRHVHSPITAEEILRVNGTAHGHPVWADVPGAATRALCYFDKYLGVFLVPRDFAEMQRERAEERRKAYVNGRRSNRGRSTHSFVSQAFA